MNNGSILLLRNWRLISNEPPQACGLINYNASKAFKNMSSSLLMINSQLWGPALSTRLWPCTH